MFFRSAIADVAERPEGVERHAAALAWAERIGAVRSVVPLRDLLGADSDLHADVSFFCRTAKASNILRNFELQDAAKLLDCAVPDLRDLRQCGNTTLLDILQALLVVAAGSSQDGPRGSARSGDDDIQHESDPVGGSHIRHGHWAIGHLIADIAEKPEGLRQAAAIAWAAQIAAIEDRTQLRELLGMPDSSHADISDYCDTTRAHNILHVFGLADLNVLLGRSVPELRALKQCGTKTITDILQATLMAAASQLNVSTTSGSPVPTPAQLADVGGATYCQMAGPEPTPVARDIPCLISKWVGELDRREVLIARHRLARDRTLDELGKDLGITRERVRQIEVKVWGKLANWRASDAPSAALRDLNQEIRKAIIAMASERRLLDQLPVLADTIPALGFPVVNLISTLVPGIVRESGWIAFKPLAELRKYTVAVVLALGDSPAGAESVSRIHAIRQRLGLTEAEWPQWLGYCGLRVIGQTVLRSRAGIPEVAAALLRDSGSPMSAEDIAVKLGTESVRSIRNRLLEDPRIVRLTSNLFGLPEWGLESYQGIREEIIQRIDRGGGRVEVQKLVDELVSQFDVSPKSVQSYASGREFVREAGWLYLAGDQPRAASRSSRRQDTLAATRRCYFRNGRWWFRIDVGLAVLRGSGFVVPTGVMRLFQVAEGTERIFGARGIWLRISWVHPQPSVGSVRLLLLELQAKPGDALWLAPDDGGRIDTELGRACDAGVLAAIAHLTGVDPVEDADRLRKRVAKAIGLPPDKSWDALAQALCGRGDTDIADLIEEAFPVTPTAAPTLDEFLSALRGRR